MKRAACLLALLPAACQVDDATSFPPMDSAQRQSYAAAVADHVMENADTNRDGKIGANEWAALRGSTAGFAAADSNNDSELTRAELVKFFSQDRMASLVARYLDKDANGELTRKEFRSPAGVRLGRLEF